MKWAMVIWVMLFSLPAHSQTLGGSSVFNFLKLPNTPQLTSLGAINITQPSNDVGLAFNNPALLKSSMHTQMDAVFNSYYSGIQAWHLSMGYHSDKLNTNFLGGLTFFNYGNIQETDAAGNIYGNLHPTDWVMQVSASHSYLEKWNVGASFKFISSNYGQYRSNGIAMDIGLLFSDSANGLYASALVKNLGFQLKKYEGASPDELPFDLQIGVTKKLKNAPLSFSVTAQHVQSFNIQYNDTLFNNESGFANGNDRPFSVNKLFQHFVFAASVYPADKIEITAGYNYLRRQELSIGNAGNGLIGFSLGGGLLLDKLQVRYARAYYQNNTAYNQLGLNIQLNKYFGLGKWGQKMGW